MLVRITLIMKGDSTLGVAKDFLDGNWPPVLEMRAAPYSVTEEPGFKTKPRPSFTIVPDEQEHDDPRFPLEVRRLEATRPHYIVPLSPEEES